MLDDKLAQIMGKITEMGYVVPAFEGPTPSFYQLEDGTILGVLIRVHHLTVDKRSPSRPLVSSTTECSVFVHNRQAMPQQPEQMPSPSVKEENVPFEVLLEEFHPYKLSNGMTINVKTVLGQANLMDGYAFDGSPVYNVAAQPVFNVKNPKQSYR